MTIRIVAVFISLITLSIMGGCTSKPYPYPSQNQFEGYKLVDGVDKNTIAVTVKKDEKIAVVLRNIATTAYYYLPPRYMNSMVTYESVAQCCMPDNGLIGASGDLVYKFSFIGLGPTSIRIVARHKGRLETAASFDDDIVTTVNVNVK